MAGHTLTPYEVTATRKWVRDKKAKETKLLLASIDEDQTIDLLDAVTDNITDLDALETSDGTRTFQFEYYEADADTVTMVFSNEISGEREQIRDSKVKGRPVVFTKDDRHVTIYYSVCLLWRPPDGTEGLLLMHSPWGRGGSKTQVMKLLQAATNASGAKAKLAADALIPQKMLDRYLRNAKATKIIYRKDSAISSTFAGNTRTALAEMDLVVKGTNSIGYRDALAAALKATKQDPTKLFTVGIRDPQADGGTREETFDDVEVEISTPGGTRRYSMRNETIPTVGLDVTSAVNSIYYGLDANDPDSWPEQLCAGVGPHLQKRLQEVQLDW